MDTKLSGVALQCWYNNDILRLIDNNVIYPDLWNHHQFHVNKENMKFWNHIHCNKCTYLIINKDICLFPNHIKYCSCQKN